MQSACGASHGITVLSMTNVETASAQQALTQSQAFSAGYANCPIKQIAIGLFGTLGCDGMRR